MLDRFGGSARAIASGRRVAARRNTSSRVERAALASIAMCGAEDWPRIMPASLRLRGAPPRFGEEPGERRGGRMTDLGPAGDPLVGQIEQWHHEVARYQHPIERTNGGDEIRT